MLYQIYYRTLISSQMNKTKDSPPHNLFCFCFSSAQQVYIQNGWTGVNTTFGPKVFKCINQSREKMATEGTQDQQQQEDASELQFPKGMFERTYIWFTYL